jgi:hypothetical protein
VDYIYITKDDNTIEKMEAVTVFNVSNSNYNYIIYKSLITGDYFAGKYLGNDLSDLDTDLESFEIELVSGVFDSLVGGM